MNAWREAATFIHEGVLKIPDGATLIWADNGHGLLDDQRHHRQAGKASIITPPCTTTCPITIAK